MASAAAVAASATPDTGGVVPPGVGFEPTSPAAAATGDPLADFIRIFSGDGTADNPNAGLLFGNGFSYTG